MIRLLIADDERMEREALADIVMRRFEHEVTVEMAENGRKRRTNTNALLFEEQGVSSCRMCPDRLRAGKTRLHSESKRRFRNVRLRGFCPFFR